MEKIKPRTITKHLGRGLFTTIETKPHNHSTMTDKKLADIANFIRMRQKALIHETDFNKGMNHAYQDILFLVEDMLADPEFPIEEITNQIK